MNRVSVTPRCRCNDHGAWHPGYVLCRVDHASVQERCEAMTSALCALPLVQREARADGSTPTDYVYYQQLRALRDVPTTDLGDEADEAALRAVCAHYGIDPDFLTAVPGSPTRVPLAAPGTASLHPAPAATPDNSHSAAGVFSSQEAA